MDSRRKRVLLVTPELQYTGAVQSFRRICITLKNNGYLVDVWSYREGPFIEEFDKIGTRVKIVPEESVDLNYLKKEVSKYNLIIANTINTFRMIVADELVPTILYVREAHNLPDFFWKAGREEALRGSKRLYCVSEYAQDFISQYNSSVRVVHNFVDDVFDSCGSVLDKTEDEVVRFLALGTIEKRKGYDILIDAFLSLPEALRRKCELHFAGRLWEGAKDFYPGVLDKANVHDNIFYHGELRKRSDIHQLIADCDVVVVPSRDESCSLTALEGAMMARPLILSANVGAKYVLDESCGWIVETANVDALADAFAAAVGQADSLSQMGVAARSNYLATSTYEIYQSSILEMVADNIADDSLLYMLEKKRYDLVSFDIFDTLVSRKTARPSGIFQIMQESLFLSQRYDDIPQFLKQNFAQIRKDEERFIYRSVCDDSKKDTSIEEIYEYIEKDYGLTSSQTAELILLEIETEKEYLVPLIHNIELLKRVKSLGYKVVLISDMYLSSEVIRDMLVACDPVFEDVPLYVSCEHNAKKNTGALYGVVKRLELAEYGSWIHCGDDWNADCVQASKLGIDSYKTDKPTLKQYEAELLEEHFSSEYEIEIGRLKNARALLPESPLYELGLSFGGPLLYQYVSWVVESAAREHIDVLVFVARDGYILRRIANAIIRARSLEIETEYIYGSRIAWRDPFNDSDRQAEDLLAQYFEQETGRLSSFALVEYAGTGATVDCLLETVRSLKPALLDTYRGCYYLYLSKPDNADFSEKRSMVRLNELFSNCMELLARAPHGQTLGYRKAPDGHIEPILDDFEGSALVEYGYRDYIKGVCRYAEIASATAAKGVERRLAVFNAYIQYLVKPNDDAELMDLLGGIPFVLDGVVRQIRCYSPRLTNQQALRYMEDHELDGLWGVSLEWSLARSYGEAKKTLRARPTSDFDKKIAAVKAEADKRVRAVKASNSYRVGRFVTYVPRLIKRLARKAKN